MLWPVENFLSKKALHSFGAENRKCSFKNTVSIELSSLECNLWAKPRERTVQSRAENLTEL